MDRIFLALKLPPELRELLALKQAGWKREAGRKIRWIPPDNLHVTLKFIGETGEGRVRDIIGICDTLFANLSSIDLVVDRTGIFPEPRRPRILWAGVSDRDKRLALLRDSIETGLADLGIPVEKRKFHPHVTVARVRRPRDMAEGFKKTFLTTLFSDNRFKADGITLFRSMLQPSGPRYEAVAEWKSGDTGRTQDQCHAPS